MWRALIGLAMVGCVVASGAAALRRARTRRRRRSEAMRIWRESPPGDRVRRLRDFLRTDRRDEVDGTAWYLLGSAYLREDRPIEAARAFGMAYHADCRLETAALLTFACLKTSAADLPEMIAQTWIEMCRPPLWAHPDEEALRQTLAATTRDPPRLSPLGQLAWLASGPARQARLEALAAAPAAWARPFVDPPPEYPNVQTSKRPNKKDAERP